jgi:hypothetical protein
MSSKSRDYSPYKYASEWFGRFTGYRVNAWGKHQVLNAPIEIAIRMEYASPAVWVARAYPGAHGEIASSPTAEDCMRRVEALFVTQLAPWVEFRWQGLGRCQLKRWNVIEMAERQAG